jgi:hypothetical protein
MSIETLVAAAIIAAEDIEAELTDNLLTLEIEEPKYPRSLQEVAAIDLSFLGDDWKADMLRDAMK